MSLSNLQFASDEKFMQSRLKTIKKELVGSFRQAAANGNFKLGIIDLQNQDLNRIHGVVTEINSRRAFYNTYEDELPRFVFQSINEVRTEVKQNLKGVWADQSCEHIMQEMMQILNKYVTELEKLEPENLNMNDPNWDKFVQLTGDLRLRMWFLVAYFKKKVGGILNPNNMPDEVWQQVNDVDP